MTVKSLLLDFMLLVINNNNKKKITPPDSWLKGDKIRASAGSHPSDMAAEGRPGGSLWAVSSLMFSHRRIHKSATNLIVSKLSIDHY